MPACQVRLELDEPSATYQAGSKITGRVLVSVTGAVKFRTLKVRLRWETHGKGNPDKDTATEVHLLEAGTWTKGQQLTFPFELQAPSGPVTYHGHYVNLDWFLEAIVDIPWAPDAEDSVPIALVGGPPEPGYAAGPSYAYFPPEPPDLSPPSSLHTTLLFVAILLLGLGVLFLVLGFVAAGHPGAGPLQVLGPLLTVLGLVLLVASFANIFSERGIGKPRIHIEPMEAAGGGLVQVRATLRPRKELELLDATVTLRGQEETIQGSGSKKRTYGETLHDAVHAARDRPKFLEPGRESEITWEIPIPPMAPPTLQTGDNRVTWALKVSFDLAGWPNWTKEFAITVLPTQGVIHSLQAFETQGLLTDP